MKKIFIIFLLIILNFSFLKAEVIKKTIIDGNKRIADETIILYGDIQLGKDYSEAELNEIIKNLYSTNFFEDVQVSLNNNTLKLDLVEYPVLNQLIIIGEKSNKFIDQIKKIMQLKEKRSFIKSRLVRDVENIKNLYSSLGYNFTKVEAKVNEVDKENFDLILEIERGNKTKIKKVNFVFHLGGTNRSDNSDDFFDSDTYPAMVIETTRIKRSKKELFNLFGFQ